MASTLSDIRTQVRDLIDQPNDGIFKNPQLNRIINDAAREVYQEILRRQPKYLHKSSTVSTTASTPYTDVPSDCVIINKIVNSSNETLAHIDLSSMDTTSSNGPPEGYEVTGPHIFWWPTPDAVYVHTIYYHHIPADMSADSDVPTLPYNCHDVISYGAAIKSRMSKEDKLNEYYAAYESKLSLLLHTIAVGQTNEAPRIKGAFHDFYIFD
jgi:hypothetical protein